MKIFGIFRVKNHDFTQKNHIFFNFRGAHAGTPPPPWIRPCTRVYRYQSPINRTTVDSGVKLHMLYHNSGSLLGVDIKTIEVFALLSWYGRLANCVRKRMFSSYSLYLCSSGTIASNVSLELVLTINIQQQMYKYI